MASSMAAAAAHSMPPFPLPAVRRIRPPPIPKGTPGPNTLPQPGPPPRKDLVWVDGRWASPNSRSAQHKRVIVSKQLEKALQHEVNGMNIYAYKHFRTQQVVYSLTKNMDNTKIMKQLLYHGKKTVPAALRRDVWTPYFSVHFPKTPAGSLKGLRVFQELRELSALRQLQPPKEMITATQKDLDTLKTHYDSTEWLQKTETAVLNKSFPELPVVGERLPRKMLAKRLMNQAATSVADVAAILTRQTNTQEWMLAAKNKKDGALQATGLTPQQRMDEIVDRRKAKAESLSIRANNRLSVIRKKEEVKAEQLEERQQYQTKQPGMVSIDHHARDRINIEYDGVGQKLTMIEEADKNTRAEIGATVTLQRALKDIEEEKQAQRQDIENRMSTQIEQRLMEMTEDERIQIEKEVEIERGQKQSEIDAQITAAREKAKDQRAKLYEQPKSTERRYAIRKLSRELQAEIYNSKTDLRARHLKWVGPFASIATEVDRAISVIDARWEPTLAQLREEVEAEKKRHADLNNHEVEIRWANLRDGTHAKSWPDSVFHIDLQAKAVAKGLSRVVTTHSHYDGEEDLIETQYGMAQSSKSSTIHVFGSAEPDTENNAVARGRYESPSKLMTQRLESRAMRVQEWANTEAVIVRDRIVAMRIECNELERLFAGTVVNPDVTRSIADSMDAVKTARKVVDDMTMESYSPLGLQDMNLQLQYIRDVHAYCLEEIADSANPIADEARVKYAMLEADLMVLESQNHEARQQATVRLNFYAKFNERERLEREIELFRDAERFETVDPENNEQERPERDGLEHEIEPPRDQRQHAVAIRNLETFDAENSIIGNVFVRRAYALENFPIEIKAEQDVIYNLGKKLRAARRGATKNAEQQELIASLEEELRTQQQSLSSKTAELKKIKQEVQGGREVVRQAVRADKEAWIEFKREKSFGSDSYFESGDVPDVSTPGSQGAVAGDKGMVMEQPEDTKGRIEKSKDTLQRGGKFFGLGRFFGR